MGSYKEAHEVNFIEMDHNKTIIGYLLLGQAHPTLGSQIRDLFHTSSQQVTGGGCWGACHSHMSMVKQSS